MITMLHTVLFFFLLWLSLILSILLFIVFPLFYLPGLRKFRKSYIGFWTRQWARFAVFLSGSKIVVSGKENIPDRIPFAIISNHQGYMDIPVLMTIFPYPLSFITKRELLKVPFINLWILALDCLLIDRRKPLASYRKISGKLNKSNANPIIIFPEGTRSQGSMELPRKKGGINLIETSGIRKVNVKIDGTYRIWEESGRIKPAIIRVEIN